MALLCLPRTTLAESNEVVIAGICRLSPSYTSVSCLTSTDRVYVLESAAELGGEVNWRMASDGAECSGTGAAVALTDTNSGYDRCFYRIRSFVPKNAPGTSPCDLYPIALFAGHLVGAVEGQTINDVLNASQSGHIGWLTWTGSASDPTLAASLTPPGDSAGYVNPGDTNDHVVSVGDWVCGAPGTKNSSSVRAALDALIDQDITVPVWDVSTRCGSPATCCSDKVRYHVIGFANIRITSYQLPCKGRITAVFLGMAECGGE
jgi:hypothetical protein